MEKEEDDAELERFLMEVRAQAIGEAFIFPAKREEVQIRLS